MPIIYEVDRIRDGKSFTTRRVVGIQHGHAIFSMSISFHNDEPGLDHQMAMPEVPHPDELPSDAEIKQKILPELPEAVRRTRRTCGCGGRRGRPEGHCAGPTDSADTCWRCRAAACWPQGSPRRWCSPRRYRRGRECRWQGSSCRCCPSLRCQPAAVRRPRPREGRPLHHISQRRQRHDPSSKVSHQLRRCMVRAIRSRALSPSKSTNGEYLRLSLKCTFRQYLVRVAHGCSLERQRFRCRRESAVDSQPGSSAEVWWA